MTSVRDGIVRSLWRGRDPFRSTHLNDGVPDLQGWGSQHQYLTDGIETARPTIIVEIGVWKGASVIHMASRLRDLNIDGLVIAVDTWLGSAEHWMNDRWFRDLGVHEPDRGMFSTFVRNVRSFGLEDYIVPLPVDSINASEVLRRLKIFPDLLHIDAGHDYGSVMADLKQWWPLLKPGGLLIGDDYRAGNDWPGVKRAFDDYFRPLGLIPIENTNEKCRVYKPQMNLRESSFWARLMRVGAEASAWRETRRLEMVDLIENDELSVTERLERYVRFTGPNWPDGLSKIQRNIAKALGMPDHNDAFSTDGEVKVAVVRTAIPGFYAHYYRAVENDEFERFELLSETDNLLTRFALPGRLNRNMSKPKAPPFYVSRIRNADIFVTALGYQLFRAAEGIYWPAASTRPYAVEAMEHPNLTFETCLVIVQDSFEGTNFSHFLFDWVPRVCHFLNAGLEDPASCTFLMGGVPSEFHFRVVEAICEIYAISQTQFMFPQGPEVWHINGPVYAFSDFKYSSTHPANMANRSSIAIIREVCSRIHTIQGDVKRLYISRDDTPLRRVMNGVELSKELGSFGFVEVQLGTIPFLEQLRLVRGAEVIVAPHGMGLTHIAFHEGKPLIVELHNPMLGTDTYAFPAHALGFRYRAVIGSDLGGPTHHFTVRPGDVANVLIEEGFSPTTVQTSDALSRVRSVFVGGVQSVYTSQVFDLIPLRSNTPVYKHVRDESTVQPDNNTGWLEVSGLVEGALYHCSCEIWLPASFKGNRVSLDCTALISQSSSLADPTKIDEWQTIHITGIASETLVNFVLRCEASAGSIFYSSGWRLGLGSGMD